MIEDLGQATGYGIRQICASLKVPRGSFYHAASPTATASADRRIGELIAAIFTRHRRRYGDRRIAEELSDAGVVCAPDRIRRIMRARGLRALQPKTYGPKTSDGRADQPSPNLLLDQPLPAKPDQVWAGDITFIPTAAGWLYLAVVIDLCSRKIVGWSLADHLRADLVGRRSAKPWDRAARFPISSSTATGAASMAAALTASFCARPACVKACPRAPIPIPTPGPNCSWAP
jgi:hypothetical protein